MYIGQRNYQNQVNMAAIEAQDNPSANIEELAAARNVSVADVQRQVTARESIEKKASQPSEYTTLSTEKIKSMQDKGQLIPVGYKPTSYERSNITTPTKDTSSIPVAKNESSNLLARTVPTTTGGTITVTSQGKVTETTSIGRIIDKYGQQNGYITPKEAQSFFKQVKAAEDQQLAMDNARYKVYNEIGLPLIKKQQEARGQIDFGAVPGNPDLYYEEQPTTKVDYNMIGSALPEIARRENKIIKSISSAKLPTTVSYYFDRYVGEPVSKQLGKETSLSPTSLITEQNLGRDDLFSNVESKAYNLPLGNEKLKESAGNIIIGSQYLIPIYGATRFGSEILRSGGRVIPQLADYLIINPSKSALKGDIIPALQRGAEFTILGSISKGSSVLKNRYAAPRTWDTLTQLNPETQARKITSFKEYAGSVLKNEPESVAEKRYEPLFKISEYKGKLWDDLTLDQKYEGSTNAFNRVLSEASAQQLIRTTGVNVQGKPVLKTARDLPKPLVNALLTDAKNNNQLTLAGSIVYKNRDMISKARNLLADNKISYQQYEGLTKLGDIEVLVGTKKEPSKRIEKAYNPFKYYDDSGHLSSERTLIETQLRSKGLTQRSIIKTKPQNLILNVKDFEKPQQQILKGLIKAENKDVLLKGSILQRLTAEKRVSEGNLNADWLSYYKEQKPLSTKKGKLTEFRDIDTELLSSSEKEADRVIGVVNKEYNKLRPSSLLTEDIVVSGGKLKIYKPGELAPVYEKEVLPTTSKNFRLRRLRDETLRKANAKIKNPSDMLEQNIYDLGSPKFKNKVSNFIKGQFTKEDSILIGDKKVLSAQREYLSVRDSIDRMYSFSEKSKKGVITLELSEKSNNIKRRLLPSIEVNKNDYLEYGKLLTAKTVRAGNKYELRGSEGMPKAINIIDKVNDKKAVQILDSNYALFDKSFQNKVYAKRRYENLQSTFLKNIIGEQVEGKGSKRVLANELEKGIITNKVYYKKLNPVQKARLNDAVDKLLNIRQAKKDGEILPEEPFLFNNKLLKVGSSEGRKKYVPEVFKDKTTDNTRGYEPFSGLSGSSESIRRQASDNLRKYTGEELSSDVNKRIESITKSSKDNEQAIKKLQNDKVLKDYIERQKEKRAEKLTLEIESYIKPKDKYGKYGRSYSYGNYGYRNYAKSKYTNYGYVNTPKDYTTTYTNYKDVINTKYPTVGYTSLKYDNVVVKPTGYSYSYTPKYSSTYVFNQNIPGVIKPNYNFKPPYVKPPRNEYSDSQKNVKRLLGSSGFGVLVKRRGKFMRLQGVYTRKAALDLGAGVTGRTLAATFKLERASGNVRDTSSYSGDFDRIGNAFRNYQIRQGRRIQLDDTYIQRRGYRLSSQGERKSIQASRSNNNFFGIVRRSSNKSGGMLA